MDDAVKADAEAKRRRLAAGLPGQGPPADPTTAVLLNPTLLAKIWPAGDVEVMNSRACSSIYPDLRNCLGKVRVLSKDARVAFDAACEAALVFAPQRQRYRIKGREPAGPSPSQALDWALGMLRRGRRPRTVRIGFDERICLEGWQEGALDLLRVFPELSGRQGEGVVSLLLPPELLSPSTAPLIAGAFPNLSRLELSQGATAPTGVERPFTNPEASEGAARGLALLLGVRSGPEGGEAHATAGEGTPPAEAGEGAGSGPEQCRPPLLPCLTALGLSGAVRLPPGYAPLLQQVTQLRTLELSHGSFLDPDVFGFGSDDEEQAGGAEGPVQELASLTQLTALSLSSCAVPLLPVLTGALTRLTSLELSGQESSMPFSPPLSPALFAPLQGLQRLEVPNATLEVTGLAETLSCLTRLSVGGFTLPAQELSQPLTSIPRWRLPAGLRELGLGTGGSDVAVPDVLPEALAGLELHSGLRLDPESTQGSFVLIPGRHTEPPVEVLGVAGTELLPAAEEALCGALSFTRRFMYGEVSITFKAQGSDRLMQPFGGAAGTGPGRPNHGRWLREVAALGPTDLTLEGFQLSYQDVEEMRDGLRKLETLALVPPCELPILSLPLLAGLPRLRSITLDATPWAGDDPAGSELRGQALASIVALARARPDGRDLALELRFVKEVEADAAERVKILVTRAEDEMAAWGVRPLSMVVEAPPFSDSDALDA